MNFSDALQAAKEGKWIARAGWSGKGMHVYAEDSHRVKVRAGVFEGSFREYAAYLVLYNTEGKHQPGWLPSQADLFTDDWRIIEPS